MRCATFGWMASASRLSAFAHDAQRIEAPVLVQVFHRKRGDFRAAEAHLQAHRENRPVAESFNRVFRRGVEQLARVRLGEGERRFLPRG